MASSYINGQEIKKIDRKEMEEVHSYINEKEAAALANDSYKENEYNTINGWKTVKVYNDPKTGFKAKLYEKQGHYAFVTAGTDAISPKDWQNNVKQQFGFEAKQYEQSIKIAQSLSKEHENLIFIGHSLGGGLASANSRATGRDAITFNASALNNRYNYGMKSRIVSYISDGDILDYTNQKILGSHVQGQIIRRPVQTSAIPNLQYVPGTGPYQFVRGVIIHLDTIPIK